ncbi:META domain-containing protein [Sphingomonas sp. Leaf412]|uniref:META domain-containing protein n=1 Tax=Sphingomonas sp. Leaf412 TaxID=1736370 RepID=UPI000A980E4B|nr:META domain-containing protein [Sphingomonas sp. Leaf412]
MIVTMLLAAAAQTPPTTYRAVGTEPFWSVTVAGQEMRIEEPGVPAVILLIRAPQPIDSGWRWHNRAITMDAVRAPCSDGMSDRTYPDRVTLSFRGRTLTGCGGAAAGSGRLADTAWRVVAIDGRRVRLPRPATIRFTGDRIEGNSGCNRFGGGYALDRDRLTAARLATTRMACVGTGMAAEQRLLGVLAAATVTWRGERTLVLSGGGGSVTLRRE